MKKIIHILQTTFEKELVFVVGGAVRDRYIKKETFDIDLVLKSNPLNFYEKLAKKVGGHGFVLDSDRKVIRITVDGFQIDISQAQGKNFEADLDRRDFSINALSVPLSKWTSSRWKEFIVDRHSGLKDLQKKIIRQISSNIYVEDPLRLLRAFRFAGELGFQIDALTLNRISKDKKLIKKSSPERVREEFLKMFSTEKSYSLFVLLEKTGLLSVIWPEANRLRACGHSYYGNQGVLKHTLDSLKLLEELFTKISSWFPKAAKKIKEHLNEHLSQFPRFAHLKWAIFMHDFGKPKTAQLIDGRLRFFEHEHVGADMVLKMADRFRWSQEETNRYSKLVRNHMRPGNLATHSEITDKAIHRFFKDLGDDGIGMLLVSLADHLSYLSPAQRRKRNSAHELATCLMVKKYYSQREVIIPPKIITGYDIMKLLNIKPSPVIGQIMSDVTEAQSEGKIRNKNEGLQFIKNNSSKYLDMLTKLA
ncbi:MAG: CCA tRNA nucleotidyltransferase [Elusimicrobiota bacterium]